MATLSAPLRRWVGDWLRLIRPFSISHPSLHPKPEQTAHNVVHLPPLPSFSITHIPHTSQPYQTHIFNAHRSKSQDTIDQRRCTAPSNLCPTMECEFSHHYYLPYLAKRAHETSNRSRRKPIPRCMTICHPFDAARINPLKWLVGATLLWYATHHFWWKGILYVFIFVSSFRGASPGCLIDSTIVPSNTIQNLYPYIRTSI